MEVFNAQIQLRCDSKENWESHDPVLEEGEPGVIVGGDDHGRIKIGDGSRNWTDLPCSSNDDSISFENERVYITGTGINNGYIDFGLYGNRILTYKMYLELSTAVNFSVNSFQRFDISIQNEKIENIIDNSEIIPYPSVKWGFLSGHVELVNSSNYSIIQFGSMKVKTNFIK